MSNVCTSLIVSGVVKTQKLCRSHEGFLTYAMYTILCIITRKQSNQKKEKVSLTHRKSELNHYGASQHQPTVEIFRLCILALHLLNQLYRFSFEGDP